MHLHGHARPRRPPHAGAGAAGDTRSCRSGHRTGRSGHRTGGSKIERDGQGQPITAFSTAEFEAKRDELLAAAKHGAVLVSPCISDGEREIARLAFAAGASVIALRNMGFSPLYKPGDIDRLVREAVKAARHPAHHCV